MCSHVLHEGDRDVVAAAVQQTGSALQFATAEMKHDRELVKKADF